MAGPLPTPLCGRATKKIFFLRLPLLQGQNPKYVYCYRYLFISCVIMYNWYIYDSGPGLRNETEVKRSATVHNPIQATPVSEVSIHHPNKITVCRF